MSDAAIRVSGLSKQYKIGAQRQRADTLRDAVTGSLRGLVRRVRANGAAYENTTIWALKNVSFDVKRGEVLGVIGRNGAGKSTLLKILSRITEPTTGEVDIYGRVGSLLEVGTGFHAELSGRENIFLNGAILGMKRREVQSKFDEIVDFSGVEQFIDTPVKHYSSGMYMRLAFAVAAHMETEILLVDEVLAVGDAEFQKKCLGKMGQVASEGRTVMLVSHNIPAVLNLCRSAMLVEHGQLSAWGEPSEVVAQYLHGEASQAAMTIDEHRSRQGTGEIRFKAVRLLNEAGEVVEAFRCGDTAIFGLVYENCSNRDLRNFQVAIGIDNYLGERIAVLSSDITGESFAHVPAEAECVEITVERLPLGPGRYGCTLFSSLNGVTADWVQNVGSFEVHAGDYYGSGKLPPASQGAYLMDYHFSLRRTGQTELA